MSSPEHCRAADRCCTTTCSGRTVSIGDNPCAENRFPGSRWAASVAKQNARRAATLNAGTSSPVMGLSGTTRAAPGSGYTRTMVTSMTASPVIGENATARHARRFQTDLKCLAPHCLSGSAAQVYPRDWVSSRWTKSGSTNSRRDAATFPDRAATQSRT